MKTTCILPVFCLTISIIVSVFQAYRGYRFQEIGGLFKDQKDRKWLLCWADAFTYFVCSLTGFIALFALGRFLTKHHDPAALHDNALMLVFLLLYGISGITGKMPQWLNDNTKWLEKIGK